MLNIHYDYQIFALQRYGGISRYFCELAAHLSEYQGISVSIGPFLYQNRHLANLKANFNCAKYIPCHRRMKIPLFLLNAVTFETYLKLRQTDIVHRTYYYASLSGKYKQVVTVHDLIPEKFPQCIQHVEKFLKSKQKSIQKADHIICDSRNTKEDLIEIYKITEDKVSVVHLGSSLANNACPPPISSSNRVCNGSAPYILFVGSRTPYKNFISLIQAISISKRISHDFSLICFGGLPFTPAEKRLFAANRLNGKIIHVDGDDNLLINLYRNAELLVYPSIYEGFGIPIIEAMSLGCPVVCSKIAAFEEVAGCSALFFDPLDQESIADALETVLYSSGRREMLRGMGYNNSKKYSWESCAAKTLSIYNRIR